MSIEDTEFAYLFHISDMYGKEAKSAYRMFRIFVAIMLLAAVTPAVIQYLHLGTSGMQATATGVAVFLIAIFGALAGRAQKEECLARWKADWLADAPGILAIIKDADARKEARDRILFGVFCGPLPEELRETCKNLQQEESER